MGTTAQQRPSPVPVEDGSLADVAGMLVSALALLLKARNSGLRSQIHTWRVVGKSLCTETLRRAQIIKIPLTVIIP